MLGLTLTPPSTLSITITFLLALDLDRLQQPHNLHRPAHQAGKFGPYDEQPIRMEMGKLVLGFVGRVVSLQVSVVQGEMV